MNLKYTSRITKIVVIPEGDPIYSERATSIEIVDESGGEFVRITQEGGQTDFAKSICFDPDEWNAIKPQIDRMIDECRGNDET